MKIINKLPHTPYFIFVKGVIKMSDLEILQLFNLAQSNEKVKKEKDLIYISRDKDWVHLMDNNFYTFWHSTKLTDRINELGKKYEVFTCSVGDCDMSFDFKYYKGGEKVREYVVESPNYNDQILKVNYGLPLSGERAGLEKKEPFNRVTYIANSLGIELPRELDEIMSYEIRN